MLSIKLMGILAACALVPGGIARAWIFDPEDYDFTQAVPDTDGNKMPYTAVALRTGATAAAGAKMFPIIFNARAKEAEYTWKQTVKNGAAKYEHQVELPIKKIGQMLANFTSKLDIASVCGGVGLVLQLNDGTVLVAGERYVNGAVITIPFDVVHEGSSGGTGKEIDDANSSKIVLKGDASRLLYEYTGGVQSLVALQGA